MALINYTPPADGETADASDVVTPLNTIYNEFNGNIDNANIKSAAAIDGSKLANGSITPNKLDSSAASSWAAQTWTPTITGYSANPSNSSYSYIRVGNLVFCQMTENTNGTSNATTKTYTLPFTAKTRSNASWRGYAQIVNNGSGGQGLILVDSGASTVQFYATNNGGAWTASGSASIVAAAFWYEAA